MSAERRPYFVVGDILACAFLVELAFLNGRKNLAGYEVFSVITF